MELGAWPAGVRVIVRRERPHPGAQLSFTDADGYRFQAILTDQTDPDIAVVERRHRQRARVEDRIRDDKDTGLAKLPFKDFWMNEVWVQIVALAHDLLIWTQTLLLEGDLAKAEPKRLRYQLLHVAARLAFSGRRARLPPPEHLALGQHATGRVRKTQDADAADQLRADTRLHQPHADHPGHQPRSLLPSATAHRRTDRQSHHHQRTSAAHQAARQATDHQSPPDDHSTRTTARSGVSEQAVELIDQVSRTDVPGDSAAQTAPGVFVDDVQDPQLLPVLGSGRHKVIGPTHHSGRAA